MNIKMPPDFNPAFPALENGYNYKVFPVCNGPCFGNYIVDLAGDL